MKPQEKHFFEVNLAKLPVELRNDPAILRTSQQGKLLAFAYAVLEEKGYFDVEKSLTETPRPLLTFPLLDYLSNLDLRQASMYELGAGHSTLFFQQRFAKVDSLETDARWYQSLLPHLHTHVSLQLVETANIENAEIDYAGQDWMLIDFAGARTKFIQRFFGDAERTQFPTYLILDNAEWYRNGARFLHDKGYSEIPFFGMKAAQTWVSCTSVFVKQGAQLPQMAASNPTPAFVRELDNTWDYLDQ